MMRNTIEKTLCLGMLLLACTSAHAGIQLGATRLIYAAGEKEATVPVKSTGTRPVLVQSWITDADNDDAPEQARVPFAITPPMFRLEGGASQVLRIKHRGDAAAADRETMYWLNVYEIPSREKNSEEQNLLEIATRTRIKVFVRPKGLAGQASDAPSALTWKVTTTAGHTTLTATNPTGYHVNFGKLALKAGEVVHDVPRKPKARRFVAPFSTMTFELDVAVPTGAQTVVARVINDHGGSDDHAWAPSP
jgi:chaperone protein EcpD